MAKIDLFPADRLLIISILISFVLSSSINCREIKGERKTIYRLEQTHSEYSDPQSLTSSRGEASAWERHFYPTFSLRRSFIASGFIGMISSRSFLSLMEFWSGNYVFRYRHFYPNRFLIMRFIFTGYLKNMESC